MAEHFTQTVTFIDLSSEGEISEYANKLGATLDLEAKIMTIDVKNFYTGVMTELVEFEVDYTEAYKMNSKLL